MYTITAVKQTQTTTWSKQVKSTLDPLSGLHTHIWNLTPSQQHALLAASTDIQERCPRCERIYFAVPQTVLSPFCFRINYYIIKINTQRAAPEGRDRQQHDNDTNIPPA